MDTKLFKTPILFIIFNRPDTTQVVFNEIKKIKPEKLFVSADGPRANKEGEHEKCIETRKIIEQVDWDCKVKKLYRDKNLGCKSAVSSAITWFFENIDCGIILEDDCLPDGSFFRFCEELLEKYKNDERVMTISGNNYQFGKKRGNASYYFSAYNHIWGWASWKRAWTKYDVGIRSYPEFKSSNKISGIFKEKAYRRFWLEKFDEAYTNRIDTWDYQLTYMLWNNNGLSILPNVNLVTNIGFGAGATHTKNGSLSSGIKAETMAFPLKHPDEIKRNIKADSYTTNLIFIVKYDLLKRMTVGKLRDLINFLRIKFKLRTRIKKMLGRRN
jgi:hypothetical protein